jgi:drug/metabolite transporter (DMT)-like permease
VTALARNHAAGPGASYAARPVQTVTTPPAPRSKVVLALTAVYLIWGSTYLVLRFALESFPPFLMGGVRYLLAGVLLYGLLRRRGVRAPARREWGSAAWVGTLLFGLGNGLVALAEQSISSGAAAIVVATTPLWAVLFTALLGSRAAARSSRPRRGELLGLLLGLLGVGLLQRGGAFAGSREGLVAIVLAPVAWALGSVLSARLPLPAGAMAAAAEMIAGGAAMLGIGALRGERLGVVSLSAVAAFAYLVIFGSLLAFSAYQFLLERTPPALATSYAFVNPSVALILGWLFGGEPLGVSQLLACGLIALAVLFVLRARRAMPLKTAGNLR